MIFCLHETSHYPIAMCKQRCEVNTGKVLSLTLHDHGTFGLNSSEFVGCFTPVASSIRSCCVPDNQSSDLISVLNGVFASGSDFFVVLVPHQFRRWVTNVDVTLEVSLLWSAYACKTEGKNDISRLISETA